MKTSRLLAAAIFLLTQTLLLLGQTAPNFENGFKLYGSYDGSHLDTVNLMNGNLMLHIPVMPDVSQRGAVTVSHTLFGSSKGWQVICVYGGSQPNCDWENGGNTLLIQRLPGLSLHRTINKSIIMGAMTFMAYGYSLTTADGNTHELHGVAGTEDANGYPTQENRGRRNVIDQRKSLGPTTNVPFFTPCLPGSSSRNSPSIRWKSCSSPR